MTTIISGIGLGLFNTSANVIGNAGNALSGRAGQSNAYYINSMTGNLVVQAQDEFLSAVGLDASIIRTYNSRGQLIDDNGDNWQLNIASLIGIPGSPNAAGSTVTKRFGDGAEVVYTYDATRGLYTSNAGDGANDTLSFSGGTWTWTNGDTRASETYNSAGRLTARRDTDGNLTSFTYAGALLTQIADASGQSIFFDYSGNNLTQIREVSSGATQTLTRYGYDALNRLTIVTVDLSPADNAIADGRTYVTRYTYDVDSRRLASITNGDTSSVSFTYEADGAGGFRVKTYTDGAGKLFTLDYTVNGSAGLYNQATASNLTTAVIGWAGAPTQIGGSAAGNASSPQTTFWGQGDGMAAWTVGSELQVALYTKVTESWSASAPINVGLAGVPTNVQVNGSPWGPTLVTWMQNGHVYARRYVNGAWDSAVQQIDVAGQTPLAVSGAINRLGRAVVAFVASDGTQRNLYASVFNGTAWQTTPANVDDVGGLNINDVATEAPSVGIDGAGNIFALWRQSIPSSPTIVSARVARYTAASASWAAPSNPLTFSNVPISSARIAVDDAGHALAMWNENGLLASRLFYAPTGNWGAYNWYHGNITGSVHLVMNASGDALATWVYNGNVYAYRYMRDLDTPREGELVESLPGAVYNPVGSLDDGGRKAVAFVQVGADGIANLYVNRFTPVNTFQWRSVGTWQSSATLVESNPNAIATTMTPSVGIGYGGNVHAFWAQRNGATDVIYTNRYNADFRPYYKVQAGDTWAIIAQRVYGDANAATALQTHLGNPALVTGAEIELFPQTFTYGYQFTGNMVRVVEPDGYATNYISDAQGRLRQVRREMGNTSTGISSVLFTTYEYDARDNVIRVTDGNGKVTTSEYDANNNLIQRRDATGSTVTYTYNSANQRLTETQYLVADADGAGPGPGLPSQPLTTRYIYDAEQHLRFTVSGEGRVSELRYDAPGNLTATIRYTGGVYNVAALTPADALTEAQLTTWIASQNLTRTERTDYTYDFRGQVNTATIYTTVATSGAGVADGTQSVTKFVYDQRGRLLQTLDPRGSSATPSPTNPNLANATTYIYDGLGRITSATQWVASGDTRTTLTSYDDAGNRASVTLANGLTTVSTFDRRGLLTSAEQRTSAGTLGTTIYKYDDLGQLRITIDPQGNQNHRLYDHGGRLVATIDPIGAVTEYVYDNIGNVVQTIAHSIGLLGTNWQAQFIDAAGNPVFRTLAELSLLPIGTRETRHIYDAAGRLVMTIVPHDTDKTLGYVTHTLYDGAGRITDTLGYANPISLATLTYVLAPTVAEIQALLISSVTDDRRTRHFYDKDGELIGTLDGEGGFCEYQFNAAGELIHTIHYATPATAALRLTGTFDQLKASVGTNANDQHTYKFYNSKGQLVAALDQEGYLTEYTYNIAGSETQVKRWHNRANAFTGTQTLAQLRPAAHQNDAVTIRVYNGANEVTSLIENPAGTETRFTYNNVGLLIRTDRAWNTAELRTDHARYDVQGRVLQELSARGGEALAALGATPTQAQIDAVWNQWALTHTYDSAGRRLSTTDPNGNRTLFYYDEASRLRYTINALGEVAENRYNDLGDVTSIRTYGARLSTTGLTGGAVTTTLANAVSALYGSLDLIKTINYTLRGAVRQTFLDGTASTAYAYNAFGELDSRTETVMTRQPDSTLAPTESVTRHTYDRRGLLAQTIEDVSGLRRTTSQVYDAFGRATQATDGASNVRSSTYDKLGRILTLTDAAGTYRTTYDAFDRVLTQVDALNNTVATYAYNDTARSFTLTTAENLLLTTTTNRHGETATFVDANGNTTVYTYDKNGNVTNTREASGTLNLDNGATYDRADRLVTATNANGKVVKTIYDAANRVLSSTVDPTTINTPNDNPAGLNLTTSYTYDGQGRTMTTTDPRGTVTQFIYNNRGELTTQIVDPTGLNLRTTFYYSYELQGRRVMVVTGSGAEAQAVEHYYDNLGRLIEKRLDPTGMNLITRYVYDGADNLVRTIEGNGNVTRFFYDAAGRLTYTLDGTNGLTQTVYDANGSVVRQVKYANVLTGLPAEPTRADIDARLAAIADATRDVALHSVYNRDGRLIYSVNALGEVTQNTYDGNGNVVKTTRYVNRITLPATLTVATVAAAIVANTAADVTTYAVYDQANRVMYQFNALGETTRFFYDNNGNVTRTIQYANRIAIPATINATTVGFSVTVNAAADLVTNAAYDAANRLIYSVNAKGEVTEYRYDANSNVTRTIQYANRITIPATITVASIAAAISVNAGDIVTHAVYDAANRLTFTIDAQGAVTRNIHDTVNNVVKTITYATRIVIPATLTVASVTAALVADADVDQVNYAAYDKANRLVYTVDGFGNVTQHFYDAAGQRVATTRYVFNIIIPAAVTVATMATAVFPSPGEDITVHTVYDAAGRVLYRVKDNVESAGGGGEVEHFLYDGAGQLTRTIRYANRIILSQPPGFLTAAHVTPRLVPDATRDVVVQYTYDRAGRLTGSAQLSASGASLGTTLFFYDAEGRLAMTQDPTGVRNWSLYDQANRKVADIDGNGTLTEYVYNANGELIHTITYATAINVATLVNGAGQPTNPSLASIRPAANPANQRSWFLYDNAGRLVKTIDAQGAVTETDYDGAGRVRMTRAYATTISTAGMSTAPTLASIAPPTHADDRVGYNFYDNAGLLRGSIDGDGYLTEFTYNTAGQLLTRTRYATALPATWQTQIPTWNANPQTALASIRPATNAADIVEKRLYNQAGQLAAEIDGENYLTEYGYYGHGQLGYICRYANRVTVAVTVASSVADLRPATNAEDRSTSFLYDATGRLFEEINAEGAVTLYSYDTLGRLIRTDVGFAPVDQRTLRQRYDIQGNLIGELTGEGSLALQTLLSTNPAATPAQIDAIWTQWGVTHSYDAAGRRTATTDQYNNRTLYFYNVDGELTHTVNAMGEVTERRFNTLGQLTDTFRYGATIGTTGLTGGLVNANLTARIANIASATLDSRERFTYNTTGTVDTTTDARGQVTDLDYNAFGQVKTKTFTDSIVARRVIEETLFDRRGNTTQTRIRGELATTEPQAALFNYAYDAFGRVTATTDTNRNVRTQSYDRLGRVVTVRDAMGFATSTTTYDAFDRVLTLVDGLGNTVATYTYNKAARSRTLVTAEGVRVTTVMNAHGETQTVTDSYNNVTNYSYDKNGNLRQTTVPVATTSNTYDRAGRLATSVDGNGNVVKLEYDAANRVFSRTVDPKSINAPLDNPNGLDLATFYIYDAKGQQISVIDANGVATSFEYSLKGELTRQIVDAGGLNLVTTFTYDGRGNTLTVTDPNSVATVYTYDAKGQRTSESHAGQFVASYQYDGNGNVIRKTDANGRICRYVYDVNDRLIYTIDQLTADGLTSSVQEHRYDRNGRVTQTTLYANSISINLTGTLTLSSIASLIEASWDRTTHSVYDRDGRLAASIVVVTTWEGSAFVHRGEVTRFTYDLNGNVTEVVSYANRLNMATWTPGTLPAPAANAAQDRRTRTIYDAGNRATYIVTNINDSQGAIVRQFYDGNGNVTERIAFATPTLLAGLATLTAAALEPRIVRDSRIDQRTRFFYDHANRLSHTVNGVGAVNEMRYDGVGNVVKTIEYANGVGPASLPNPSPSDNDRVTVMTYDAANRLTFSVNMLGGVTKRTYDNNGNLVQTIAYAQAIEEPSIEGVYSNESLEAQVFEDTADRTSFTLYDFFNRAWMSIDPAGAVVARSYDLAGNLIETTAFANPIDLTGLTATNVDGLLFERLVNDVAHDRTTRFQYDARNRAIAIMDAMGFVTSTEYGTASEILSVSRYGTAIPAATAAPNILDALMALPTVGEVRTTTYIYDTAGRVIETYDPASTREAYTYDAVGNRLTFTNKNGATWTYAYDAAGHMTRETSPQVALTTLTQTGEMGALSVGTTANASVVTLFSYDALGNLRLRTEASGRPEERSIEYVYDALGRQVRTNYPSVGVYNPAADDLSTTGLNPRRETARTLFAEVTYDTLGNAVSNMDVAGNRSFRTYDKAGQLEYEFDAEGGVTYHGMNTFGEETLLTRFATAYPSMVTGTGQTRLQVGQVNTLWAGANRTLVTERDQLGRVSAVIEPNTFVFEPHLGGAETFIAGKTTRTSYNAFGEVFQVSTLQAPASAAGSDIWHYLSTNYYDRNGQLIEQVDALGYVTTQRFDAAGNVTRRTEYAATLGSFAGPTWDGANPPATPPSEEAYLVYGGERTTEFGYDLNNRKISMTRKNIEYTDTATLNPSDPFTFVRTGDAVTTYGYDAVGNLTRVTDPMGATTYTYYDALGRVRANVAPTRAGMTDAGSVLGTLTLSPLTEFRYDAHGNAVAKLDYVFGARNATVTGYEYGSTGSPTRNTYSKYNVTGDAIQTTDAAGVNRYSSYNERGEIAKGWQGVTDSTLGLRTTYTAYRYDKVGRLTQTTVPAPTSDIALSGTITPTVTTTTYNAYGDVIARTVTGTSAPVGAEYFHYDAAGHLWRTNSGDGVDKIFLYDLQGRQTAQIVSGGNGGNNVDLKTVTDASAAATLVHVRRTDYYYDAMSNLIRTVEPERVGVVYSVDAAALSFTPGAIVSANGPFFEPPPEGQSGPGQYFWDRDNEVNVNMSAITVGGTSGGLGLLGSGELVAVVHYRTKAYTGHPSITTSKTFFLGAEQQTSPTFRFTWNDGAALDGGIGELLRVEFVKKDLFGHQVTVGQAPQSKPALYIPVPQDGSWVELRLTRSGSPVVAPDAANFGEVFYYDLSSLPAGAYQYSVIIYSPEGSSQRVAGSGTLNVTATSANRTQTIADAQAYERPIFEKTYDRWGNILTITDPRGDSWVTTFTYNADNKLTEIRAPEQEVPSGTPRRPVTKVLYDRAGRELGTAQANYHYAFAQGTWVDDWNLNTNRYDAGGNLTEERHADGGIIRHTYNFFGERVVTRDALGFDTRYTVDALGRVTKIVRPAVAQGTVAASPSSTTLAATSESFTYDEMGNKLTRTLSAERVGAPVYTTRYRYDLRGNIVDTIQPMGERTLARYDAMGRKMTERDANGNFTLWSYDYFGRLNGHTDIGGANHTYAYDNASQLVRQTNTRGQDIIFTYDTAGQLKTTVSLLSVLNIPLGPSIPTTQRTEYAYDLAGYRVLERTRNYFNGVPAAVYQDNHMRYDAQGRLTEVADTRAAVRMEYDLLGNRTHISRWLQSDGNISFTNFSEDRYFSYDKMNRQIVVDGYSLTADPTSQAMLFQRGHYITYDLNGNRTSDTHWAPKRVTVASRNGTVYGYDQMGRAINGVTYSDSGAGYVTERYRYDTMNRLQSTLVHNFDPARLQNLNTVGVNDLLMDYRTYDERGLLVKTGASLANARGFATAMGASNGVVDGVENRVNSYNANGWLTSQTVHSGDVDIFRLEAQGTGFDPNVFWLHTINYHDYDNVGNVEGYRLVSSPNRGNYTNTYTYTYKRFEGYETDVIASSSVSGTAGQPAPFQPGQTLHIYDLNGNLIGVDDTRQNESDRTIVNDLAGRALQITQSGNMQRQMIVNGEVLGRYGFAVNAATPRDPVTQKPIFSEIMDFNFGYEPITANYPNASPGTYTVQTGDSLASIAQRVYGDSSLWYVIADANGLTGTEALTPGLQLTLPNRVSTVHNNSTTFRPYDPSRALGDVTPFMPNASNGGCGGWGYILAIVVTVAVAAIVGALTYGAGLAVFGTSILGVMAAGAAAGAAAAITSQAIMLGIDPNKSIRNDFKWGPVAKAAVVGAISGGLLRALDMGVAGDWLSGTSMKDTISNSNLPWTTRLGNALAFGAQRGGAAALTNAIGQRIAIDRGWQKQKFSWAEVTASGISTGIGSTVGRGTDLMAADAGLKTGIVKDIVVNAPANFAGSVAATYAKKRLYDQGQFNWLPIAADAFGNALGNAVGGRYDQIRALDKANRIAAERQSFQLRLDAQRAAGLALTEPQMAITQEMLAASAINEDEAMRLAATGYPDDLLAANDNDPEFAGYSDAAIQRVMDNNGRAYDTSPGGLGRYLTPSVRVYSASQFDDEPPIVGLPLSDASGMVGASRALDPLERSQSSGSMTSAEITEQLNRYMNAELNVQLTPPDLLSYLENGGMVELPDMSMLPPVNLNLNGATEPYNPYVMLAGTPIGLRGVGGELISFSDAEKLGFYQDLPNAIGRQAVEPLAQFHDLLLHEMYNGMVERAGVTQIYPGVYRSAYTGPTPTYQSMLGRTIKQAADAGVSQTEIMGMLAQGVATSAVAGVGAILVPELTLPALGAYGAYQMGHGLYANDADEFAGGLAISAGLFGAVAIRASMGGSTGGGGQVPPGGGGIPPGGGWVPPGSGGPSGPFEPLMFPGSANDNTLLSSTDLGDLIRRTTTTDEFAIHGQPHMSAVTIGGREIDTNSSAGLQLNMLNRKLADMTSLSDHGFPTPRYHGIGAVQYDDGYVLPALMRERIPDADPIFGPVDSDDIFRGMFQIDEEMPSVFVTMFRDIPHDISRVSEFPMLNGNTIPSLNNIENIIRNENVAVGGMRLDIHGKTHEALLTGGTIVQPDAPSFGDIRKHNFRVLDLMRTWAQYNGDGGGRELMVNPQRSGTLMLRPGPFTPPTVSPTSSSLISTLPPVVPALSYRSLVSRTPGSKGGLVPLSPRSQPRVADPYHDAPSPVPGLWTRFGRGIRNILEEHGRTSTLEMGGPPLEIPSIFSYGRLTRFAIGDRKTFFRIDGYDDMVAAMMGGHKFDLGRQTAGLRGPLAGDDRFNLLRHHLLVDHESLLAASDVGLPAMKTFGLVKIQGTPFGTEPALLLQNVRNVPIARGVSRLPYNLETVYKEVFQGPHTLDEYVGLDSRAGRNVELTSQLILEKKLALPKVNFLVDGVTGQSFLTPPVHVYQGTGPLTEVMQQMNAAKLYNFLRLTWFGRVLE